MTLEQFKRKAKKILDAPGVYFFLGKNKKVLYIGKATSVRDRLRSYFVADIAEMRSPLIAKMIDEARDIAWRATDSVLEALILEANLIKYHKPAANTDQKDDKSWNYVVITKENFPRVLLVRGKELETLHKRKKRGEYPKKSVRLGLAARSADFEGYSRAKIFGPFPHGVQLKEALKLIRKIFPYRDTCTPGSQKPCFNAQLGLCPGVCIGKISQTEYHKTIRNIRLLFEGKKKQLVRTLQRDMRAAAKQEHFEKAAQLRRQLFALEHIQDISLIKEEYRIPSSALGVIRQGRIEAYDVAHLAGSAAVGVMVVVEDGTTNKKEYRTFKIRSAKAGDDPGALREVLARRLGHEEWPLPRLVVVDGATAQLNAAKSVLEEYHIAIPVVGVVKDEKHRPREIRGLPAQAGERGAHLGRERDILLANAEAHRFAIKHHRSRFRRQAKKVGAPGR